jgi:hypothetical protein
MVARLLCQFSSSAAQLVHRLVGAQNRAFHLCFSKNRSAMKTRCTRYLLGLWLLGPAAGHGQKTSAREVPLRISLLTETVSLPSVGRLLRNVNPGLSVGTEFQYRQGRRHQWIQMVHLGGFFHRRLANSAFLTAEAAYRVRWGRARLEAKLGPGYLLNRAAVPLFRDTGSGYVRTAGFEHRLLLTTGLGLGVRVGRLTPFLAYNLLVQTPFLQRQSPVLPHQLLQVGLVTPLRNTNLRP